MKKIWVLAFCLLAVILAVVLGAYVAMQKDTITAQEAEALCRDVLGECDAETGFPIAYRCTGSASQNGTFYYVMHITWQVNGAHWSYIGNCFVSYDGKEIYDGTALGEKYEITALRWKK